MPGTSIACPKCGYVRSASDVAPDWQCPACGIAIHKYRASRSEAGEARVVIDARPAPARLPLANRLASAAPDLAMCALFLWCWIAPTAWRPTLASELGSLMLMEFFALHLAMFLGGTAPVQRERLGVRLATALTVIAFYVPVAGAFAYFHAGWPAFLGFGWLLLARVACMLAGQGSGEYESKRMRFYWGAGVAYYVLCIVPALVLPLPQGGFRNATGLVWDKWWALAPVVVIAWGFLYFASQAVIKLLEQPEWIEKAKDPA